jgi:nucleotide-binding universal stress UspA family protein
MKNPPDNIILLPYDFSEVSKYAVKHAVALAKPFANRILLLNILDERTLKYMKLSNMKKGDLDYKLQETAEFIKKNSGIETEYFIKEGPIKTICKIAEKKNVMFMVVGIDEPKGGKSEILKMVSSSPVPVLVVQQKAENTNYRHILFPLDDFHASRQKTGWAAKLAKVCGSRISIIAVKHTVQEKKFRQETITEQVEEFFHKKLISYTTTYGKGSPKDFPMEALQYGIDKGCDVFVIMHRPKTAFYTVDPQDKNLIFNEAKIPVLCVNVRDVGHAAGFN